MLHCMYTTFCLSNIWVATTFWLLWIGLLWIWLWIYLLNTLVYIFFEYISRSEIMGLYGNSIFNVWEVTVLFSIEVTRFYSVTNSTQVQVSLYPNQHFYFLHSPIPPSFPSFIPSFFPLSLFSSIHPPTYLILSFL